MTSKTQELEKLLATLFEKFKNEFKQEVMQVIKSEIKNEISCLNIPAILNEQNKNYEILSRENKELQVKVIKQEQLIENLRRKNNLIFYGIPEPTGENFEALVAAVLDICNKIMAVDVSRDNLNFVRRLGQFSNKNRPVVVSLVSNICKMKILRNSLKLKGSKIYVAEDYDPEMQLQRKELVKIKNKLKELGHSSKLRRNGLIVGGKFIPYSELCKRKEEGLFEKETFEEVEEYVEDPENKNKKRKVLTKGTRLTGSSSSIVDFFRPRSDSASSSRSSKKGDL